jgi:HNH endonuclease
LESDLSDINQDIGRKAKKLKPSTSYDSDFWTANAEISHLCQLRAGMQSRLKFLEYKETSHVNVSEDDWQGLGRAENLERQILAYRQAEDIAKKQASRLQESRTGLSALFVKLFTSSPQGLNIKTGVGRRETSDQSNMVQQMRKKYCPDAQEGFLWDPVNGRWERACCMHAAHLYSWRQVESMDAIFGLGAKAEIFSPENGLFLDEEIEKALDHRYCTGC